MAEKKRKNYYAIHYIGSGENIIVKTLAECQKKTKGRANMFKGFATEKEAREWFAGIDKTKETTHQRQAVKSKEAKKSPTSKVSFQIKLERQVVSDFNQKASSMNMSAETLLENLILEYLYDPNE